MDRFNLILIKKLVMKLFGAIACIKHIKDILMSDKKPQNFDELYVFNQISLGNSHFRDFSFYN